MLKFFLKVFFKTGAIKVVDFLLAGERQVDI
jgi:hypothetical protein